jgi:hypothetical protein
MRFILGAQLEPSHNIEVLYPEKTSFRPSKWPLKFRNQKTAKNSKLPEDCFKPIGTCGWPLISTWINTSSLGRKGIYCVECPGVRENHLLNLHFDELLSLLEKL